MEKFYIALISVFFPLIGMIQYKLFVIYNKTGHPWAKLLTNEEKSQDEDGKIQISECERK